MNIRTTPTLIMTLFACLSCGKKDHNGKNQPGDFGGGSSSSSSIEPTANLHGAVGLLVVDVDPSQGSALMLKKHNDSIRNYNLAGAHVLSEDQHFYSLSGDSAGQGQAGSGSSSLQKVDGNGDIKSAITVKDETSEKEDGPNGQNGQKGPQGPKQALPKILTIAVSPAKDVYLHFERPFIYREVPPGVDAFSTDGYQCQIFKVKGGTLTDFISTEPTEPNLECVDDSHVINNWQTQRNSVFQFDADSNVYYPGSLRDGGGKTVVYRKDRLTGVQTEMINANICVQDFVVTKSGGIFYTGNTCANGNPGGGGGGGFFRYVMPAKSGILEIANNWWNFIFDPIVGATGDKAVFFGPDPRSATTAGWNSACLFNFDPEGATATERISNVITCGGDIWSYLNMGRAADIDKYSYDPQIGNSVPPAAWLTEFSRRCVDTSQVFAGGGSQISSVKQDSLGNIYVIGNIQKKVKGIVSCDLQVKGPHCTIGGMPVFTDVSDVAYTSATCTSASGTWVDDGFCDASAATTATVDSVRCFAIPNAGDGSAPKWSPRASAYNGVTGNVCKLTSTADASTFFSNGSFTKLGSASQASTTALTTTYLMGSRRNCNVDTSVAGASSNTWTSEYQAFAKVNPSTLSLELKSTTTEKALKLWLVNDIPYYSSFDSSAGKYYLKNGDGDVLAENFETYNLSASSIDSELFYDGLDFTNNSYSFGSALAAPPYTRTIKTGLTGTVKTIVIFPK